jgi:large subunit ribosomal protein L17
MRHKVKGRKLGRNASHRKAMFRNMAASLIRTLRVDEDADNQPKVQGRIITTVPKAKELRPFVEKLITIAKKALPHQEAAGQHATTAERNSTEWKSWRTSDRWQKWSQAIAPAVKYRRTAFALLRDKEAVTILFDDLAPRFRDRVGGYTRIVEIAQRRQGDGGRQALIEFVGERDRVRQRKAPVVEPAAAGH